MAPHNNPLPRRLRRLVSPAIILVVGLGACHGDYQALNEENPKFRQARAAHERGDYDTAIRYYKECLRLAPQSYKAHLQLAMIYEEPRENLPLAIAHYEAYLDLPQADSPLEVRRLLDRVRRKYCRQLQTELSMAPEPQPAPAADTPTANGDQTQHAAPACQTYTVQAGDTLSRISVKFYGTPNYANTIFAANRRKLQSPDRLQTGQVLRVPVRTADRTEAPNE